MGIESRLSLVVVITVVEGKRKGRDGMRKRLKTRFLRAASHPLLIHLRRCLASALKPPILSLRHRSKTHTALN